MPHSSPTPTHANTSSAAGIASGEHWYDLTATLSRQSRDEFGVWLSAELDALELALCHFSTPISRQEIKPQRERQ